MLHELDGQSWFTRASFSEKNLKIKLDEEWAEIMILQK